MIIGLTGTNGSGKGTVATYFKEKGFQYHSLSDELRMLMKVEGIEITLPNLVTWGNNIRRNNGADYLAQLVIKNIKDDEDEEASSPGNHIIDSIRNPGELEAIKKAFGKDFRMVAVDAPIDVRYERVQKRAREDDKQSLEEFKHNEEVQLKNSDPSQQQLTAVMEAADVKLDNSGSVDDLHKELEKLHAGGKK